MIRPSESVELEAYEYYVHLGRAKGCGLIRYERGYEVEGRALVLLKGIIGLHSMTHEARFCR